MHVPLKRLRNTAALRSFPASERLVVEEMNTVDSAMWHDSDDALIAGTEGSVCPREGCPAPGDPGRDGRIRLARTGCGAGDHEPLVRLGLTADAACVRGPAQDGPRMLVFDGEEVTIELEIGDDVLMGQVVPAKPDRVMVDAQMDGCMRLTQTMLASSSSGVRHPDRSG